MKRFGTALVAFGLLAGGVQASEGDQTRLEDRVAIEALLWRYVRALDTYDAEAYASAFTEDGQFGTGPNATKGRAALAAMVEGLESASEQRAADGEARGSMHHVIANSNLEFVSDSEAHFHSYWMTVFGAPAPGELPRVAAAGRGIDVLVKVDGEWLIKSRDVAPQD